MHRSAYNTNLHRARQAEIFPKKMAVLLNFQFSSGKGTLCIDAKVVNMQTLMKWTISLGNLVDNKYFELRYCP